MKKSGKAGKVNKVARAPKKSHKAVRGYPSEGFGGLSVPGKPASKKLSKGARIVGSDV